MNKYLNTNSYLAKLKKHPELEGLNIVTLMFLDSLMDSSQFISEYISDNELGRNCLSTFSTNRLKEKGLIKVALKLNPNKKGLQGKGLTRHARLTKKGKTCMNGLFSL
jgi:hypothetical protein